jgi:hypothetical protein
MGEPGLFPQKIFQAGWATIKLLFCLEHKELNDRNLSLLSDFMLFLSVVYALLLLVLLGYVSPNLQP